ncbi:hypothetical protein CLOM_g9938 [Closterium sp. NIES-68]|nr:hypothetical protein CLOM_g9938 [Closterium sp. NIES-68]GJP68464.1 hypothetical protein CLOP_g25170 [Closterium sp. NIES-67]
MANKLLLPLLIAGTGVLLVAASTVSVMLPLLPATWTNRIVPGVALEDFLYYCSLVPMTAVVLVLAVYGHWLCIKLYRHA